MCLVYLLYYIKNYIEAKTSPLAYFILPFN